MCEVDVKPREELYIEKLQCLQVINNLVRQMCKETDTLEVLENINKIETLGCKQLYTGNQYLEETCGIPDALLAVKLDPAVLEAQVTLTKEDDDASWNDSPALVVAQCEPKVKRSYPSYQEVLSMQQAALLGLTHQQLVLLMAFVDTLRRQRQNSYKNVECAFCKNNGSPASWYGSHALRDRRRVRCPILRALRCPRCGATGDKAHTAKYCPEDIFSDSWSCP